MTTHEETAKKLDSLRAVRGKTILLEKTRIRLLHDVKNVEEENENLDEYRIELAKLQKESQIRIEQLRQLQADVNTMEVIINQAEEARDAALNNVEMLSREYFPLRQEINKMRESDLGLGQLPPLAAHDRRRLAALGMKMMEEGVSGADIEPCSSKQTQIKTCPSCMESIHKNAPHCPICKAKFNSSRKRKIN